MPAQHSLICLHGPVCSFCHILPMICIGDVSPGRGLLPCSRDFPNKHVWLPLCHYTPGKTGQSLQPHVTLWKVRNCWCDCSKHTVGLIFQRLILSLHSLRN
ncbi:hypothetical protein DPMN_194647 [Dreissena polymorpha]|uniref:Uncharacterized protein n=1 Tax=Dreissena polymorpha TaxID=45954 RepID=A0A9D3XYP6_DREPO|nr:hypothetical protein DPMN_194647 [Dreissena polymorpha]